MDSTNLDTNSLLQGQDINSLIGQSFQPYATLFLVITIFSIILTIGIVVLWILGMVRRRKVQAAILDIQATLREMNERDKARFPVSETISQPDNVQKVVAEPKAAE